jgi:PadR family transcriptional regulator, regulatory protein PadR
MGRKRHASKQVDSLLRAFLEEPERWRFGYELSKELRIGSGTLYPALMRLAEDGYLEQRWDDEHAKPRHMYRLAPDGLEFARVRLGPPLPTLEAEAVA